MAYIKETGTFCIRLALPLTQIMSLCVEMVILRWRKGKEGENEKRKRDKGEEERMIKGSWEKEMRRAKEGQEGGGGIKGERGGEAGAGGRGGGKW